MRKRKYKRNSDGSVDHLRQIWESDEHWEIRKNFISENRSKFDHDELVVLSHLYHNIQILGCTYAPEVMNKVEKLAQNLHERQRKRRKTFVTEENANEIEQNVEKSTENVTGRTHLKIQPVVVIDNAPEVVTIDRECEKASKTLKKPQNQIQSSNLLEKLNLIRSTLKEIQKPVTNSAQLLGVATSKCHLSLEWKYEFAPDSKRHEPTFVCVTCLDGIELSKGTGKNKKSAKVDSCQNLMGNLEDQKWLRNLFPDQIPSFPDPEFVLDKTEIVSEIDLKEMWILVKKHKRKLPDPVRLVEFVCGVRHYKANWKTILISDTKSTNDFNYFSYLAINGNCVGKGKGGKRKNSKNEAANHFLSKLEEDFGKEEKAIQIPLPPRPLPPHDFFVFQIPDAKSAIDTVRYSASVNKKQLKFEFNGSVCEVHLEGQVVAAAVGRSDMNKSMIKTEAAQLALSFLKKNCYTIQIKALVLPASEVSKNDVTNTKQNLQKQIPSENVGNKLLRSMGWTGGGLGKDGTGIKEPIKHSIVLGRRGLGLTDSIAIDLPQLYRRAKNILENYAESNEMNDLVFTNEFTSEERQVFHKMAHKLGLKSNSKGKDEQRHLIVSRKYTPKALFHFLIECGGSTDKYELIPPADGF